MKSPTTESSVRLKTISGVIMGIILLATTYCSTRASHQTRQFFDLQQDRISASDQTFAQLRDKRIILVGEQHNSEQHHQDQLYVIQRLHSSGINLAIGMEMFRSDSQDYLNRWVSGQMSERDFKTVYYDNWNYDWPLYQPILVFARDNAIPVVGLNVPREITRQVSRKGFGSLTKSQRGKVSNVVCRVDKEYMDYIKQAYGAHAHGDLNFTYFCEAQMLWDAAMAANSVEFLKKNPDTTMVVLAGMGHVRKQAIPTQIRQRSQLPYVVILPGVSGSIDPDRVTDKDADFLLLAL